MNETTFLYGALLTAFIGASFVGLIYGLMEYLNMFRTFPVQCLAENLFGSYSKKNKVKSYIVLFISVFIISLLYIHLMQGAKNPYMMAVYASMTIFVVLYPIVFSGIFRNNFWYKQQSLFVFYIISHSIYWWILVVFYVVTVKWGAS
ncbi:MAG: hypothetical protein HQK84_04105 [Nitrospinae bacterium]|nr:hypothetical protein [Nitrospinota bacterium]